MEHSVQHCSAAKRDTDNYNYNIGETFAQVQDIRGAFSKLNTQKNHVRNCGGALLVYKGIQYW